MPIQELKCSECKEHFEIMLSFKEWEKYKKKKRLEECPYCGTINANHEKVWSGRTNLNFIGNWYATTKSY